MHEGTTTRLHKTTTSIQRSWMFQMGHHVKCECTRAVVTRPGLDQTNQLATHAGAARRFGHPHGVQTASVGATISITTGGNAHGLVVIKGDEDASRGDERSPFIGAALRFKSPGRPKSVRLAG